MDNIVLREIDFHITNKCNMNCIHCLYDSGKKSMDEMELDDIKRVIKEFSIVSNRSGSINLFGGEIFVRKDIFNIIETVKEEGLKLGIITNGYFNETIFKKIVECKPERLTIDLDGASVDTHDWLRNKKGSFEKSIDTIRKFIENKINVSVTTVLNKRNVAEIENMLKLCEDLGIYSISFFMMTPLGRGENLKEYVLNGNEWIETKNKVQNWVERNKPKFSIIWENAFIEEDKSDSQKILCNNFCGDVLNIKCNGDVYFCGLLTSQDKGKIGNVRYESLGDIIKKANTKVLNMKGCFALQLDESKNKKVVSCNAIAGCPYNIEQLNKYMEVN